MTESMGTVTGRVGLQGRSGASAVTITACTGAITLTSNAIPNFTLTLPPGVYTITASVAPYLPAALAGVLVTSSESTSLPNTTLWAGDADGDGAVGMAEMALVGLNFGKTSGFEPGADINGDGIVNIFDLVLVGGNYGRSGVQRW
jgi:hypothetical protein